MTTHLQKQSPASYKASFERWLSFLSLPSPRDRVVTVNHSNRWLAHLYYAQKTASHDEHGFNIREYASERFSTSMVVLTLLLAASLDVLFGAGQLSIDMRTFLRTSDTDQVEFWAGLIICYSILLSLIAIVTASAAWGVISVLSRKNARSVIGSSLGLYAFQYPHKLFFWCALLFIVWNLLFIWTIVPLGAAIVAVVGTSVMLFHVIGLYSALGCVIMYTGAMGHDPIFEEEINEDPGELSDALLRKAKKAKEEKISIADQYQRPRSNSM